MLDTQAAAHTAIAPTAASLRERVYRFLASKGPATDETIQRQLHMSGNTERPRRRELQEEGRVYDSGLREPTASGRQAVLWRAR